MMLGTLDPVSEVLSAIRRDLSGSRMSLPMRASAGPDQLTIELFVPGVDAGSLDLDVDGRILNVSVDRPGPDGQVLIDEVGVGKVRRRLVVNPRYDLTRASADLVDGVLTVTVPVREDAKVRKIQIGRCDDELDASGEVADTTEVG